jgi:hypothetical protein
VRRRGLSGQDEDAGADDGPDAERGQVDRSQHAFELCVAGRARLELVNGFRGEESHGGYNAREPCGES